MSELEKLRPEVREAMDEMDRIARIVPAQCGDELRIIRAELLRLANENFALNQFNVAPFKMELEGERMHVAGLSARCERAEAELAALKQREQDAATALVPKVPTSAMLDAAVALALNVTVHGAGGWSNYMRDVWGAMLAAQEHDDGR